MWIEESHYLPSEIQLNDVDWFCCSNQLFVLLFGYDIDGEGFTIQLSIYNLHNNAMALINNFNSWSGEEIINVIRMYSQSFVIKNTNSLFTWIPMQEDTSLLAQRLLQLINDCDCYNLFDYILQRVQTRSIPIDFINKTGV